MSLEEIRREINGLDEAIVRLLERRARAGREIGGLKKSRGLPLRDPEREREVLSRLRALSDGSLPPGSLDRIYRAIIAETLSMQEWEASRTRGTDCGPDDERKRDVSAVVLENVRVAPGFHRMRLGAARLAGAFRPGQFFQMRFSADAGGPFLRRPFAPSAFHEDGFSFVYAVVGSGTRAMALLGAGARVHVLAPLGNGYRLPDPGSRALLLGGGCGAPSLAPLAERLRADGCHVTVLLGARAADALLEQETFGKAANRLVVSTDDGSRGCRGTVVDAFRRERDDIGRPDRVYACGPLPMLRAAAELAAELGAPCQVSLEERMACGFGACMGCAVPVRSGAGASVFRRVCHDGPVFDAEALAWDEMR